ncbi:MAG: helix-turn-helix domain-containing protein [Limisphaerales bacterium]
MSQKVYQLNSAPASTSEKKPTVGEYFQLWNAVKKAKGMADQERIAITRRVLKCVPRVTEMSQEQLAKMIRVWTSILKGESKKTLPTPQCSSGDTQSRPFPARAAKVTESAGQCEQRPGMQAAEGATGAQPAPLQCGQIRDCKGDVGGRSNVATDEPQFFTAAEIALAIGRNKKYVHRVAARDQWPCRGVANRLEYCPPANIANAILSAPERQKDLDVPTVKFTDLVAGDVQQQNVLLREKAVTDLNNNVHLGKEIALNLVVAKFRRDHPLFNISVSSLRRWADAYAAFGLDGLVEQKRGRVGKKAFALDLDVDHIFAGQAAAVEYGIKGRQNIASAYRELIANPTISGDARRWMHGNHPSKSYVPPSVRKALRVPALAVKYIQQGAKAAKLDGPYTPSSYENVPAGRAFTADDMTANCYVWVEWPNERGWILIRPQILAALDIGTLAFIEVRGVVRAKGQYNKDDVWGLVGQVLDNYGRYEIAVFEGGTWQSNVVTGHKTGLTDEVRFGGLKSLGIQLVHTRSPRGKVIENRYAALQTAADRVPGYCGRMEMKDAPEDFKRQKAEVESGKAHPSKYFLSLAQYMEHLQKVMQELNSERNDGKILRGQTPAEKWASDNPQFEVFPDSAKWMYRSAYNVSEITRNGARVHLGTGKYKQVYYYANPEALEAHRGSRVAIFWNDYNPDTDAVIYEIRNGRPHTFICTAKRVQGPPRFDATPEEMTAEAKRKALSMQVAVSVSRSLAPHLQRRQKLIQVAPQANAVGAQIAEAAAQKEQSERIKKQISRTTVNHSDLSAALERETQPTNANEMSSDEISELFSNDAPDRINVEEYL